MIYMRFLVIVWITTWLLTSGLNGQPSSNAILSSATDSPVAARLVSATEETEFPAPPVEELVNLALNRSPSVAALRARLEASKERIAPAGALPDPMVEAMLQDINFPEITVGDMDMSMVGVEYRQGLPFPGKRKARREAARAESEINKAEIETMRRQVALRVRELYAELYAIDRELESLESARELLDMLSTTVGSRYSTGETEQEAVIKAQISLSRVNEKIADQIAERKGVMAMLNRLMDLPGGNPIGPVEQLPEVTQLPELWEEVALVNSSEVAEKQAAITAAERRVDVARLDLKPDFFAGAGAYSRGNLDHVVTFRVGVELPIWSSQKQRPLKRAAEHEVEQARQELRDAEAMVRSETARLSAEWNKNQEQCTLYREGIIPQTSVALDAARSSYLAGRGDFSTVIEDFNMWLEARVELARRQADQYSTWAQIQALIEPIQKPDQGGDES